MSQTIRSFRRVFKVDHRIHRIPNTPWPVPVPGGVSLRALAYFGGALAAVIVIGRLPLLGEVLGILSPPLRYVVLPVAVAVIGTQVAPDGRSAHRYALTWLALRVRARRRSAGRVVGLEHEQQRWQRDLAHAPDATGPELRRARITGPAKLRFRGPVAIAKRRGRWRARPADRAKPHERTVRALRLLPGERLEVDR